MLEQCPGEALCDACLAFACSVSLTEMRAATLALARVHAFVREPATCGSCRRQTTTIVARTEPVLAKCAHCSRLIETDDAVMVGEETLHHSCWRSLVAADHIMGRSDPSAQHN